MEIELSIETDEWGDEQALLPIIERIISTATRTAGLRFDEGMELSLVLADDRQMQELNRNWREQDKPTNVLSFPAAELVEPGQLNGMLAGDVVFAYETCKREAELEHKPFEHHFSHLVVHGLLHLFGYDHETDNEAEIMESLETRILAELDIADPYQVDRSS